MAVPDLVMTISDEKGRLYCRLAGTGHFEIFPEPELRYFLTALDFQIEFKKGPEGKVACLSFQFARQSTPARRMEQETGGWTTRPRISAASHHASGSGSD